MKSQPFSKDPDNKRPQTFIGVLYAFKSTTSFQLYKFDDSLNNEKDYLNDVPISLPLSQNREIIYDFAFLYNNHSTKHDDLRLILIEDDKFTVVKINTFNQKNKQDRIERRQHGRQLITTIKTFRDYIVCGDIA